MKKILGVAGEFGSATAGFCVGSAEIFYSPQDLGVDPDPAHHGAELWRYDYTVVNPASGGIIDAHGGITWFNVYFPAILDGNNNYVYSNLNAVGQLPDNWRIAGDDYNHPDHLAQPDLTRIYGTKDGIYGASGDATVNCHPYPYCDTKYTPILPGQSLAGFGVTFDYLGPQGTLPGPQSFEVIDVDAGQVIPGTTEPFAAVPEFPHTVYMLGIGLVALGFARKKI